MIHKSPNLLLQICSISYMVACLCLSTAHCRDAAGAPAETPANAKGETVLPNKGLPGEQSKDPFNYYYVDAHIVSLDAKQSLASFKNGGHVSGTPGTTIGNSTPTTGIN